ncbi:c-type cytochrome [Brevundimonas sp. 2R-24]|uniref:C-type cytochrome n=1 Tax=Peiella sedimenti TaxID=3061083 RepID=A0ABT8SQA1_9CAUL|nr:c-type cytochrome [Caulobacteraceae bacterium XZ-24]
MASPDPHNTPETEAERRAGRLWARTAVMVVVGFVAVFGVLGFVIIPVAQGAQAGIDPWSAICRAVGVSPGSPAMRQPVSDTPAQPVSNVAWTPAILNTLSGADRATGQRLAQEVCSACHGESGVSPSPNFPHLAGQSAAAIYKQLHDYRSGARFNEQMTPVAEALSEQELAAIAAYYAEASDDLRLGTRNPLPDERLQRLVSEGDPSRGIPACNACHARGAGGPIETPMINGQHAAYLEAQLTAYANGGRRNDIYQRMRTISAALTEQERRELAAYYQGTR